KETLRISAGTRARYAASSGAADLGCSSFSFLFLFLFLLSLLAAMGTSMADSSVAVNDRRQLPDERDELVAAHRPAVRAGSHERRRVDRGEAVGVVRRAEAAERQGLAAWARGGDRLRLPVRDLHRLRARDEAAGAGPAVCDRGELAARALEVHGRGAPLPGRDPLEPVQRHLRAGRGPYGRAEAAEHDRSLRRADSGRARLRSLCD